MSCPHVASCPLYEIFKSQSLLNVWKISFCESAFTTCERFKLSCDSKEVPLSMLPNGKLLNLPIK